MRGLHRVDEMVGTMVVAHHVTSADTPWEAAQKATGRTVKARTDERFWIRVTDESAGLCSNTRQKQFDRLL